MLFLSLLRPVFLPCSPSLASPRWLCLLVWQAVFEGQVNLPKRKSVKHNLDQIDCCLHCWREGLVMFYWCFSVILQWSFNDGLWPDVGSCPSSPLEGWVLCTWQNWPLQVRFPQKYRVEMPCHSLFCVILGLPATEVCLLFVHQRVIEGAEGVRSRGVWGTRALLQMNSVTTGVFRPNHHLALAIPQRQNLLCVFVGFSFTHCSVHLTVIGGEKHLDASPSALPWKSLQKGKASDGKYSHCHKQFIPLGCLWNLLLLPNVGC